MSPRPTLYERLLARWHWMREAAARRLRLVEKGQAQDRRDLAASNKSLGHSYDMFRRSNRRR